MSKKPTYEELAQRVQELEKKTAERKHTEKRLQKNFISEITNNIPAIVYVYDMAAQRNVYSNNGIEKLLGYTSQEIQVMGEDLFARLIHPDDLSGVMTFQSKIMTATDEDIFETEYRIRHKKGRWCTLHSYERPYLRNADGSLKQKIGIAIDKTDRVRTEEVLRESEERYRNFVNNASEGIYRIDFTIPVHVDVSDNELVSAISKHAIVGEVNEALSQMYGLRPKDMVDRLATDFAPKYGERALLVVRAPQHKMRNIETRDVDKSGQPLYLSESYSAVVEDGILLRIWGMQRNITDLKLMERKVIQEGEFSTSALNSLPDAFYIFDTAGKMHRWNYTFETKTGYSSDEIAQMVALDFISEDYKKATLRAIQEAFAVGESTVESQFLTKSGNTIPYLLSGKKINIDGITYLSGMGVNMSKQKQTEEEKRKALEFAAEHSKLALIGKVAGKMAHDFNNVLMGIMGNAQLAILNCDDEKTKVKLERINEFSQRGNEITSNLISFSKDQEPKQTYFKIENKTDLVLKLFEKNMTGIEINRNYRPGIPELLGDPGMIQDVLTNVIQNSIHAMSKVENPILKLKLYSQDDKVYIEIEDNGCGIPKEHQDSIYTPSFTLKGSQDKIGSYKSGIRGTGYGMSNVKKYIVEKHKGDISLESEVGKGTKIIIALRIIKNHLSLDEKKEVVQSQIYDKRRILLVEDEPAIADVQYQILTQEPFHHIVSTAVNGQIAIDIFDRNKFDVVSLDYMLPGNINGLDVYKHIRENDKDTPIMFISGNIEFLESMTELKEKDPNLAHLSKPVSNLDYVNNINELIGSPSREPLKP